MDTAKVGSGRISGTDQGCTIRPPSGVAGPAPEELGNLTCRDRIGKIDFSQTGHIFQKESVFWVLWRVLGVSHYCLWTGVTSLPESIGILRHLHTVDVSYTPIAHIPDSIGKLAALQLLDAEHADIASVPATIGRLKSLCTLDLSHTGITALPKTISAVTKLTKLTISSTKIAVIPDAVSSLSGLESLEAADTGLTRFPGAIQALGKLMRMTLSNNQIKDIPSGIFSLRRLRTLDLSHNLIENLTAFPERGHCSLNNLDISFNELESLPDNALQFFKNSQIYILTLSHNYLTGPVPNVLASPHFRLFPQLCRPGYFRKGMSANDFGRCARTCEAKQVKTDNGGCSAPKVVASVLSDSLNVFLKKHNQHLEGNFNNSKEVTKVGPSAKYKLSFEHHNITSSGSYDSPLCRHGSTSCKQ